MGNNELTGRVMEGKGKRIVEHKRNILRARGYVFSSREMRLFRIRGVYNSVSRAEDMDEDYVREFVGMHFDVYEGEIVMSEKNFYMVGGVEMCTLSVIVFESLFGMQLYVIKFKEEYLGDNVVDKSLMGMFN